MSGFFDQLEHDLVRAAARRTVRQPRRFTTLALTSALVLGVAGSAAGGTYLALRSSSIAPFAASDVTPEQRVTAGTSRVLAPRAADPDAAALPWAVRMSRSDTGLTCSTVGQARGDAFGIVGLDGEFRTLPEANADSCGEGRLLGTRTFAAKRRDDVRTVVNGIAGAGVQRVTVSVRGGKPRPVPHSPEGAFVLALRGYPEDSAPVVTLHFASGQRRYTFADGAIVDPDGGPAWRVVAGVNSVTEPGEQPPRTLPMCVRFFPARPAEGERVELVQPVCGLSPARRGVTFKPLFFATHRFHGRAASWGAAIGAKRIVVRAPGFSTTVDVRLGGTFLAFLPKGTEPKTVTVTVDGRRFGHTHATVDPPRPR